MTTLGYFLKDLLINNTTYLLIFLSANNPSFEGNSNLFKRRFVFLFDQIKLESLTQVKGLLLANYTILYQALLTLIITFSLLSVLLNKKSFKIMHILFTTLFTFIIYNPYLPENQVEANYGLRKELILCVGILIVRLMNIFDHKNNQVENLKK
jgi:hypothetical protein